MNKIHTIILALMLTTSGYALADTKAAEPHGQHPDSTKQGDYLKEQPNENSSEDTSNSAGTTDKAGKASNLEKGKSHKQKPDSGGVDVKPK